MRGAGTNVVLFVIFINLVLFWRAEPWLWRRIVAARHRPPQNSGAAQSGAARGAFLLPAHLDPRDHARPARAEAAAMI